MKRKAIIISGLIMSLMLIGCIEPELKDSCHFGCVGGTAYNGSGFMYIQITDETYAAFNACDVFCEQAVKEKAWRTG